ncbi:PucR family transcriptional regulator [Marinomonas foliarum]|uniref:PucR family transcriptional regulator n=1 Tax=Marinomonas foliarum TaxID=491950 RepID=A0ABX7IM31_9GAMM|nr:PucR family transcriptional regulator [Marinomonas foliarum]QRV23385.1 PucR family transcriptional regulator [Marinomonas foliarum]|tara:strand:- start:14259 stop:15410 length:1152 start_codon:yes stop_codon:yes gene_type:complete
MISIESLNQINGLETLQLRAGKQGERNAIRWPYIAESTAIEEWTKGGELIFVTGLNWNWSTADFICLIQKAQQQCASGIVLLTQSPYLESIPNEVLTFANEQGFPLIEQPYSLPMVNVTERLSNAIIMDDLNNKSNRWFLQHLADTPHLSEIDLLKAKELGIAPCQSLSVAFINLNNIGNEGLIKVQYLLRQFMANEGVEFPVCEFHQGWLAVMPMTQSCSEKIEKIWNSLYQILSKQGFDCSIGISDAHDIKGMYNTVSQAKQSADFARANHKKQVVHYNTLGISQLFTHINSSHILESFCHQYLGDMFNKNDAQTITLKATLQCYFDNLCSIRKTATALNIHRNTLSKRLDAIEQISGSNLDNAQQRLSIQIAQLAERFIR